MYNTPDEKADAKKIARHVKWMSFLLPVALVICLFTVILVTEIGHVTRTSAAVHSEMHSRLQTNARLIDGKIEDMYASVEAVAPIMAYEAGLSKDQMLLAMNALRDAYGFDFVVRTDLNGIAINYLGKENIDLSGREYIKKALGGTRALEFVSSGAYDTGNSFIIMCVPIMNNGKVAGAFHGSYKTENFVSLLAGLAIGSGQGCDEISIISNDGSVIASSAESFDEKVFKSLSDTINSRRETQNREYYIAIDTGSGEQYYYYSEIDAGTGSGWSIVSRMEKDYMSSRTSFAIKSAIALLAVAVCITAALLYIVIVRQKLTNELEKRQAMLSQALDAAESAGRAKSRFLSTVSHEMRTPLNAIIGFVELAKDATGEQADKYLANTQIASKQLLSVINDVLDMSSIESGKMAIGHVPFDFRQLIHSVTNIFVSQCFDKGIQYETKLLTPIDEWLTGDQLRVNQILINLLGNAVKFTSEGHVWLSISETNSTGGKVFVRFEVSDTGCGMSEEMQSRLFKPFEQETASTARKYGGSGLGLSIVKNLVALMGGAITVKSAQGKGSVFTVDIPFARCDVPARQNIKFADELRVLVVDDEEMEREYISAVLSRMGTRFTCVPDCDAALAELEKAISQNDPYGICLVDWRMPGVDGKETTSRIRSKYGSNVIVIVVSAYDHNQANENAIDAGANLFVPKPLFQSSLFDLFMTLTGGKFAKTADPLKTYDFSGKRVLLAEDNEMNQIVTVGLLEKMGAECEIARDGQEAVDKFLASEAGYYNVILMDVQMPVLNGLDAAKAIRASDHPEAKTVRIIALTANAFDEDVSRALSAGMNAHVSKPIEMNEFARALQQAFDSSD